MDTSSSLPDSQTQLEDARQRSYRSSRRASLTASWSEDGLHSPEDTLAAPRRLSAAPTSPLPPVPSPRPSASLTPTRALPPVPPPRASHTRAAPPLPPRTSLDHAAPPLPPRISHEASGSPRSSHNHTGPPLPPRIPSQIAVPPPAVLPSTGPQDPTAGTLDTPDGVPSTVHIEYSDVPQPIHHATLHRPTASLPENVARVPPALPLAPRPPLASRAHTQQYAAADSEESDGLDAASRYMAARAASTPSDAVRRVAIVDAQRTSDAMFSDRVMNFRDLGASVIKTALALHKDRVRAEHEGPLPGVVFRSAELGSADERDVRMLFSRYGIRTIIDLRSELEARASDIMMRHYPASIQPTADQSIDKLMRLRAQQVRQTIIEVAAHDYESAARPWEKTGESRASWAHRNSLRYTRSIGDPRKDALARALVHLYDADDVDDAATQNISVDTPYVPQAVVPPEDLVSGDSAETSEMLITGSQDENEGGDRDLSNGQISQPLSSAASSHSAAHKDGDNAEADTEADAVVEPPQHAAPSFAQSALDWGSDTLQSLRSYWDTQWVSGVTQTPVAERNANTNANANDSTGVRPSSAASDSSSWSSADSFYKNLDEDPNRDPTTAYGLRPVAAAGASANANANANASVAPGVLPPRIVVENSGSPGSFPRAMTESAVAGGPASPRRRSVPAEASDRHSEGLTRSKVSFSSPRLHPGDSADDASSATATATALHPSPASPTAPLVVTNRFDGNRRRYRCNVIGDNYRKKCVWASTPWSTRIKVIWRFATFNKAEAIRTIGREVLAPRGLAGSYEDYVDYCKEEFAQVMRIFADPAAYPILFHCQHGKDRTGIVAMLLLGILDVDDDVIAADYAQSHANLAPVRTRMELLDMGAVGLPPSFCDAPAPVMLNLLRHIRANYGSVRGYLRAAGLQEQEINTIAWCLRGNFCAVARASRRRERLDARRVYLRPSAARSDIFDRRSDNTLAM